jgi:dephospho-CoA kinase
VTEESAQPRQRRIGLTGGIATGKSTVARLLRERFGLPVLDADRYAREALAPGGPAEAAVLERYGMATIDRSALARIVFSDPAERAWLEGLVHPIVRERFARELVRLRAEPVVVLMIPLLFEAGLGRLCSETWLVDCDPSEQLARLMARDGLGEADARARIAAQWPQRRKRELADRVIDNRGGPDALAEQLARALGPGGAPAGGSLSPSASR